MENRDIENVLVLVVKFIFFNVIELLFILVGKREYIFDIEKKIKEWFLFVNVMFIIFVVWNVI